MLQGTLDVFSLDEVLGLLSGANKSGVLNITGDRGVGSVSIADGHLVGGSASSAPEANDLADVVFELLRYEEGSFSFDGAAAAEGDPRELSSVMEEAHSRLDEWKSIEAVVPSLDHHLSLAPTLATSQVTLSESEWAAIVAVGEGATVGVIARRLGLGEFDGSKRVKALIERSLAELSEPGSAPVETTQIETKQTETPQVEAPAAPVFATPEPAPASFADVVAPVAEEPAPEPTPEIATHEAPAFEDTDITAEALETAIPPMPEAPALSSFAEATPVEDSVEDMVSDTVEAEIPPMPEAPSLASFGDFSADVAETEIPPMPEPPSFADMADEPMPPPPSFDSFDAAPAEPTSFGGLDPIANDDLFEAPRRGGERSTDTFGAEGFEAESPMEASFDQFDAPMPPPPGSADTVPSFAPPADFAADAFGATSEESADEDAATEQEPEKGGSLLMRYLKSNG